MVRRSESEEYVAPFCWRRARRTPAALPRSVSEFEGSEGVRRIERTGRRSWCSYIIAVSEFVCHSPNTTTRHHRLGDNSCLCLALAAQKKDTTHKYNISAREPRGTDVILAHFLFFHPYKKCAKITSVPPGSLADMLHLHVVCFFCAASARRRRESSPKADGGRLLFLGVANKFRNGNNHPIRQ